MADGWPEELLAQTGRILDTKRPSQGTHFDVDILTTERGRFVLKRGDTPALIAELDREAKVLAALTEHSLVAQPVAQTLQDGVGFFLFTYLDGETIADLKHGTDVKGRHRLITKFARTLQQIHEWTPPLPRSTGWLTDAVARAAENARRMPGPLQLRGPWDGADPRRVAEELAAWLPSVQDDIVWGHGDYCLPNVLVKDGTVSGVIDWSAGGYADRRFDIATARWTIRYNLGDEHYFGTFLDAYGYGGLQGDLRYFEDLYALL